MNKYIDELTELICDVVRARFPDASLDDGYDVADDVIAKLPTIEVSEDCISREQVRAKLDYISYAEKDPISIAKRIVDNAPSVVPKDHSGESAEMVGEWLHKRMPHDSYHITGQCSICKERSRINNYCPWCGAKMKGADDD